MYRQPPRKKVLIQRTIIYSLMTISVIGLVVVLAFVMLGYQFNSSDGKIEQGGLVQFDSRPTGATVTINGLVFGTRTTAKTTMSAGDHSVEMNLSGYETWKKNITVTPGSVLWLNYTRLIPKEKKITNVADFDAVSGALSSQDKKKIIIKESAALPALQLADISGDEVQIKKLTLPESSYTHPTDTASQQFVLDTWDPDSRFVLVKHLFDGKHEWIVVDTENVEATKNITTLVGVQASRVAFSNSDSSVFYAQIGSEVRKINLKDATLSRPLISNAESFELYGDSIVTYVSLAESGKRHVGYYMDGSAGPRVVKTFTDTTSPLKFVVGRYFNQTYEAISLGESVEVLAGDLPRSLDAELKLRPMTNFTIAGGAQYLSDHTNGRFVVAQNGPQYTTFDLELNQTTKTTLEGEADVSNELKWLDDYTVWSDRDGMLRTYEFDGENRHELMKVTTGLTATLSPNGKYIYGFLQGDDGRFHLTRLSMTL